MSKANVSLSPHGSLWLEPLRQGLAEDAWQWDWTTLGIPKPERKIRAKIVAKSEGVWAASGLVTAVSQFWNGELRIKARVRDGAAYRKGAVLCEWEGSVRSVLAQERTFLNLASFVGGIATRTRRMVEAVRHECPQSTPRVTCTRKTLPGYKDLSVAGVILGGGHPHRLNLSAGVLIKENHIAACGGIARAIEATRRAAPHGLKIEVEVRNSAELRRALRASADVVMLDNFSPEEVREAVVLIRESGKTPIVEVSGGLNEHSIAEYAIPGVDLLSVGLLTHSVEAVDLSLLVRGT